MTDNTGILQIGRAPTQAQSLTARSRVTSSWRDQGDFIRFPELPTELQLKVWEHALEDNCEDEMPWLCVSLVQRSISVETGPDITFTFHKGFLPEDGYTVDITGFENYHRTVRSTPRDLCVHAACVQSRFVYLTIYTKELPIYAPTSHDRQGKAFIHFRENTRIFISKFVCERVLDAEYLETLGQNYSSEKELESSVDIGELKWAPCFSAIKHLALPWYARSYFNDVFEFAPDILHTPLYCIIGLSCLESLAFVNEYDDSDESEDSDAGPMERGENRHADRDWEDEYENKLRDVGEYLVNNRHIEKYKCPRIFYYNIPDA